MHVRIEDAGQYRFPARIENILGPSGKIVAQSDNLAVANADVCIDQAHTGNDESSAFNDKGVLGSSRGAHRTSLMPGTRW
jgi:hypothetical protein